MKSLKTIVGAVLGLVIGAVIGAAGPFVMVCVVEWIKPGSIGSAATAFALLTPMTCLAGAALGLIIPIGMARESGPSTPLLDRLEESQSAKAAGGTDKPTSAD